ncbi:MAG: amino acid ABC transporter permease [Chloroflexi bacterium]|nr:amino acid ABC transporter permease [Chloroflexota bacterium]
MKEYPQEVIPLNRRIIAFAYRFPWWMVFLIGLIIIYGFILITDENRRDIITELSDNVEWTTDELFAVTYEIKTEVLLVDEQYVLFDLQNNRITISTADVIAVDEQGVLECPPDAAANCLNQRGTVVQYRDFRLQEVETPDGFAEFEGVVEPQGRFGFNTPGRLNVTTADGDSFLVPEERVLEEGEAEDFVLACNRVVDIYCENLTGRYVRFELPYVQREALLARIDIVIQHVEDGFQQAIRPTRVLDRREGTVECPDDAPEGCEPFTATFITYPERIIGTQITGNDDERTIRTVEQQTVTIETDRIQEMRVGETIECDKDADRRCQDFEGTVVLAEGATYEGELTFETSRTYKILLPGDDEAIEFNRLDIAEEERDPPACTDADAEACNVTIKLKNSEIGGRIIEQTDDAIILETVPEKTVTLSEDEIYNTVKRTPARCALNNLGACNRGLFLTIIVTLSSYSLALMIGLIIGMFRVSSNPILHNVGAFYVELVRGIPLIVLLFYFAFVIGPLARDVTTSLTGIDFLKPLDRIETAILGDESFLSEAVIGLAFGYGAFTAEVFRAGIESIHRGQMEAARSLGMSYLESMRFVILPQAIRVVLPPLGNEFIAMLKDSALISVLALPELFQVARQIASREFQARPAYTTVAWVYIVLTFMLSMGVRWVERRSRLP